MEPLESRTLLSASAAGAAPMAASLAAKAVVTPSTVTTLVASTHSAKLGTSVKVTATVKPKPSTSAVAGAVEILDNGTPIQTSDGTALTLPLGAGHKASYTFAAGNLAFWIGSHKLTALFVSTNSLPGSTSKPTNVKVTVPKVKVASNGLETATIKSGHGVGVKTGQNATVLYTGFLVSDGTIFDYATANHGGGPPNLTFTVESNPEQVIPGFDQGVLNMKRGETRVLAIPSAIGYGSQGAGSSIPPNANLVFLITLQSVA